MSLNFRFHTNEILKKHALELREDRETHVFELVDARTREVATEKRMIQCIVDLKKEFGSVAKLCALYAQTDGDLDSSLI